MKNICAQKLSIIFSNFLKLDKKMNITFSKARFSPPIWSNRWTLLYISWTLLIIVTDSHNYCDIGNYLIAIIVPVVIIVTITVIEITTNCLRWQLNNTRNQNSTSSASKQTDGLGKPCHSFIYPTLSLVETIGRETPNTDHMYCKSLHLSQRIYMYRW